MEGLLFDLSKLVYPSYIASIEVAVQKGVLGRRNSELERAHEPIDVETGLVEANSGQDDGVCDFGVLDDGGVGGVGAVREAHDGDLVGFSEASRVLAAAD